MRHRSRRAGVALQRVGRSRRPARQHVEHPGRAPVRHRGAIARPPPAGPPARAIRPRGPGRGVGFTLPAPQPGAGARAPEGSGTAGALRVRRPRVPTRVKRSAKEKRLTDNAAPVERKRDEARPTEGLTSAMETAGAVALFIAGLVLVAVVIDFRPADLRAPARRDRPVHPLRQRRRAQRCSTCASVGRRATKARDRVMALYGPIAMFVLVILWIVLVQAGFTMIFVAVEGVGWKEAFIQSGSSLFTLGFEPPIGFWAATLGFVEAGIGLGLLSRCSSRTCRRSTAVHSRREVTSSRTCRRAPAPAESGGPHPAGAPHRSARRARGLLGPVAALVRRGAGRPTSLPFLNFFRSPKPNRSWITAAGAVLGTAALSENSRRSSRPEDQPMASLCIRSGFYALQSIARFFHMPHPEDPARTIRSSLSRHEWEADVWRARGRPERRCVRIATRRGATSRAGG